VNRQTPKKGDVVRYAHVIFLATIIGKLLLGVIQLAIGALIWLGFAVKIPAFVGWVFHDELLEDPTDLLASWVMTNVGKILSVDLSFYQAYFAAHGLLHVAVAAALLFGSAWAYPATSLTLGAFVVVQLIEWYTVGGSTVLILTAIDVFVIGLTWIEWRTSAKRHSQP